jgi:hypothetical protein
MKMNSKVLRTVIGLCLLPLCGEAQSYWKVNFQGTTSRTNLAGKLVNSTITDQTLIKGCALTVTGTNTHLSSLALTFHFREDGIDTLEVVNTTNAEAFRCEVIQFSFPQSYTNLDGTQVKTFAYVYTSGSTLYPDGSGLPRGSAEITTSVTGMNSRNGPRTNITGKIQFWLGKLEDNQPADNAIIASATFNSTKPLDLP